jgi:hypothetical protein
MAFHAVLAPGTAQKVTSSQCCGSEKIFFGFGSKIFFSDSDSNSDSDTDSDSDSSQVVKDI